MKTRTNTKRRWNSMVSKPALAAALSLILGFGQIAALPALSEAAQKKAINSAVVTVAKSAEYTGKDLKPGVTVTVKGKKLKANKDYKVTYKNNKKVGNATAVITGKGSYKGTVKKTFSILPKATRFGTYALSGTTVKLNWAEVKKEVTGYQIRYSTDPAMKGAKTVTLKGASKKNTEVKGLKTNTNWYFQVRTYKKASGKAFYSGWKGTKAAAAMKVFTGSASANKPSHVCRFVAKTHTEDRGYYRKIYERHVVCYKCGEILDDLKVSEVMEKHHLGGCQSSYGMDTVLMGEEWVSVPTEVIEYYCCTECGKKTPA